jgi:predicted DNA-binding transcriptional regulator AlpA
MMIAVGDLVGSAEIGVMLGGLSRQRVQQIINHKTFPAPFDELKMGKVWWRKDVVAWAESRGRALVAEEDDT